MERTIDLLVSDLCRTIDDLKLEVEYWKEKYENERDDYNKHLNESFETSKKGIANALRFALCTTNDLDGNIKINSEDREYLKENL